MTNFVTLPKIPLAEAQPGDIVTCNGKGITSSLIRFGQRMRSPKEFCQWSHNALLSHEENGQWYVHQATSKGVIVSSLAEVTNGTYEIIPLGAFPTLDGEPADRSVVLQASDRMLGDRYSFIGIASMALNMLTPSKLVFGDADHVFCSAHVARCMEHAGVWIPRNPYTQTPANNAELAHFHG